jgi:hypothetical protein
MSDEDTLSIVFKVDSRLGDLINGESASKVLEEVFQIVLSQATSEQETTNLTTMISLLLYSTYCLKEENLDEPISIDNVSFLNDHVSVKKSVSDFLKKMVQPNISQSDYQFIRYINDGIYSYTNKDFTKANEEFGKALIIHSTHFVPRYFLTLISIWEEDFQQASKWYPTELYSEKFTVLPKIFGSEEFDVGLDPHELLDEFIVSVNNLTSIIANQTTKYFPFTNSLDEIESYIQIEGISNIITPAMYLKIKEFDVKSESALLEEYPDNFKIKKIGSVCKFLLTGEWIWKNHEQVLAEPSAFQGIDLTYLVASYFKAVELLLCKRVGYISKGVHLQKLNCDIGDITYYAKSTMGNYNWFIKNYRPNHSRNYYPNYDYRKDPIGTRGYRYKFCDISNEWASNCRNALQHKDYEDDIKSIEIIRDKSLKLIVEIMTNLK